MQAGTVRASDVTVIGGGLAGMAASLHLAKAGLRIICIEPETRVRQPVGESSPWLASPPFNVELRTIHVDRVRLDRELQDLVLRGGVTVVHDKAISVENAGMRVASIYTASGGQFVSPWFMDASGSFTSLFAREFRLPAIEYGPRKVALWAYFTAALAHEGTTIYMDAARGAYMDWIWEIPIGPYTLSVGYVTTGEAMKKRRDQGLTVEDILGLQLARFPRLACLLHKGDGNPPCVTSFSCRTYKGLTGPNWMIAGEAASMVDPITSNGVTAALRHAEEASALIAESRKIRTAVGGQSFL